jgi:hypothetical protein
MKKKIYNKAKVLFQKFYMFCWLLSIYFIVGLHRIDPEGMKFFLKIFIALSFLAIPKIIIYFKVEKNRKDFYEMMRRG